MAPEWLQCKAARPVDGDEAQGRGAEGRGHRPAPAGDVDGGARTLRKLFARKDFFFLFIRNVV